MAVLAAIVASVGIVDAAVAAPTELPFRDPGVPGFEFGAATSTAPVDDGAAEAAGESDSLYLVEVANVVSLESVVEGLPVAPVDVWDEALVGFAARLDREAATELAEMPGVVSVEPERRVTAAGSQTSPPWGLDRIDQRTSSLDGQYVYSDTGAGVIAYVIDSGLWLSHEEFAGRVPRYAYYDFGDDTGPWDCSGHGTHVAGTIGGTTYGVAKGVSIVPVKALDCDGFGSTYTIVTALEWIVAEHPYGTPAVINMSIGGSASATLDSAVQTAIDAGFTVVAAAGNETDSSCDYSPGRVDDVITVAATDSSDDDAVFSNYGSCNDIFAPGVDILSASPSNDDVGTMTASGTSMAAPHVAGAAALVLDREPGLTPEEVWQRLDAAATVGTIDECCDDPDKLVYVGGSTPPAPAPQPPSTPTSPTTPTPDIADDVVTLNPARLLDTRAGGHLAGGSQVSVQVAGRGGVPDDAIAAVLNVTAVDPLGAGYATVFPCDAAQPDASNVNFAPGQTIPNAVVVKLSSAGAVCLYVSATTQVLVDVNGYVPAGAGLTPIVPSRAFDSRASGAPRPAGSITEVPVASAPTTGAVFVNVTAVNARAAGYLTAFPCGSPVPEASNLNFRAGQTIANAVFARIGSGGAICVYTSADVDLLVDVNARVAAGGSLVGTNPARFFDSRASHGLAAGTTMELGVGARAPVPGDAHTALLNVTVLDAAQPGYVTVFPCGSLPDASNLNFAAGDTVPNAVVAKLSHSGTVCVYSSADIGVLIDVNGYAT